jgi:hypothetical protein
LVLYRTVLPTLQQLLIGISMQTKRTEPAEDTLHYSQDAAGTMATVGKMLEYLSFSTWALAEGGKEDYYIYCQEGFRALLKHLAGLLNNAAVASKQERLTQKNQSQLDILEQLVKLYRQKFETIEAHKSISPELEKSIADLEYEAFPVLGDEIENECCTITQIA